MRNLRDYDQIEGEVLAVLGDANSSLEDCLAAAGRGYVELPYSAQTRERIGAALLGWFKKADLSKDDGQKILGLVFVMVPAGSKTHREATKLFLESVARPGAPQPASAVETAKPR